MFAGPSDCQNGYMFFSDGDVPNMQHPLDYTEEVHSDQAMHSTFVRLSAEFNKDYSHVRKKSS